MGISEDLTKVIDVISDYDDSTTNSKEKDAILATITNAGTTLQESVDDDEIKEAFDCISMKCSDRREIQDMSFEAIIESGLPSIIIDTITKWSSKEFVIAQSLTTVHNSSLDEAIAKWYVTKCDALTLVVDCMVQYPTNFHIQTRGAGAIGMFMKMNDSAVIVPQIKNTDLIQVFITALKNHPDDAKLHRWVLKALMIITTLFLDEYKQDCIDLGVLTRVSTSFDRHRQDNEFGAYISKFTWSILRSLMPSDF